LLVKEEYSWHFYSIPFLTETWISGKYQMYRYLNGRCSIPHLVHKSTNMSYIWKKVNETESMWILVLVHTFILYIRWICYGRLDVLCEQSTLVLLQPILNKRKLIWLFCIRMQLSFYKWMQTTAIVINNTKIPLKVHPLGRT